MGWGQGIGIGWPNATSVATPVPTNVYYLIDDWCSEDPIPMDAYTTQLVDPNVYFTGNYVYSTTLNFGVLLGAQQSTPLDQVEIIGPTYSGCPVTALESYVIVDCILGEEYTSGYYDAGNFALGDRVYTQYGNYGWVQNTTTAQEGDQSEGFPIGYVADRCNDCNVTFIFEVRTEDDGNWYVDLYVNNDGDVPFQSDANELIIDVNYEVYLTAPEDPPVTMAGTVTFEIPSYNVPNGAEGYFLAEQYAFSLGGGGDYDVASEQFYVTSISVDPIALGPYDTGWSRNNRYVTEYGNVWTFYYP
jgi:hypothetical protein